ncbi:hypothetical protein B0H14DRAFT_2611919 [Mycena olivaceomarginata]|nr:hypothetical protein B0H14DRAFT_2611919 [Mycena olivaceomarginata]
MDLDALTTYRMDLADEEDDNDIDWDVTATAATTIVVRAVVARQRRAEQRLERRDTQVYEGMMESLKSAVMIIHVLKIKFIISHISGGVVEQAVSSYALPQTRQRQTRRKAKRWRQGEEKRRQAHRNGSAVDALTTQSAGRKKPYSTQVRCSASGGESLKFRLKSGIQIGLIASAASAMQDRGVAKFKYDNATRVQDKG